MSSVSIAIITPTLGRPTLRRTLESALPQLSPADEWFIVGDGVCPEARRLVEGIDSRVRYFEHHDPTSHYGNAQRNYAMRQATADYLLFLDDDDVLKECALGAVRAAGAAGGPLMFKMEYRPRQCILWEEPVIRIGNVAGPMFVVPNHKHGWADWCDGGTACESDFQFILETLSRWPADSLRWRNEVICRCDWHGEGRNSTNRLGAGVQIHPTANIYGSSIGDHTRVAAFVEIGGSTVGARCKIQAFVFVPPGVTIGNEVFIGPHCCFTNDRYPRAVGEWVAEPTVVESRASIGAQCTILPGVRIGAGAMIGAGITVTKNVPPGRTIRRSPW